MHIDHANSLGIHKPRSGQTSRLSHLLLVVSIDSPNKIANRIRVKYRVPNISNNNKTLKNLKNLISTRMGTLRCSHTYIYSGYPVNEERKKHRIRKKEKTYMI